MAFNDIIQWPTKLDVDFPNLRNNDSAVISEVEKFYAAHYNKIRNFVVTAYSFVENNSVAVSDGTLSRLSMPVGITIPLKEIVKAFLNSVYLDTDIQVPGNVLPFELVITYSSDSYSTEVSKSTALYIKKSDVNSLKSLFGSINPLTNPLVVTGQVLGYKEDTFNSNVHFESTYVVNCTALQGSNTLLVRGYIQDMGIADLNAVNGTAPLRWLSKTNSTESLKIAIMGVQ